MRLIDADEFERRIKRYDTTDYADKALYNFAHNEVITMPTVCDIDAIKDIRNWERVISKAEVLEDLRNDIKHMQYLTATDEYAKGYETCKKKVLWYIDRYLKGEKK